MLVRYRALAIVFTLAALPLASLLAQGRVNADSTQIVAVLNAVYAAEAKGDMTALDTLHSPDVTVIEGASIDRGWTNFRDNHLGPHLKEQKNIQTTLSEVEVRLSGNTAWAIYRYASKYDLPARNVDAIGRATAVFERANGKWKLRHLHASGRARRPTDPPGE
jgi:ketosteroid isomerase-like protein